VSATIACNCCISIARLVSVTSGPSGPELQRWLACGRPRSSSDTLVVLGERVEAKLARGWCAKRAVVFVSS